jgi:hypothetical protein
VPSARSHEPRTSGRRWAVAAAVTALAFAGCGGSEVEDQEVPGDPAEITLPDRTPSGGAAASGTEDDAATTEEATPTPTATPSDATGTTTDGTAGDQSAAAEATTPAPAEDGATTDEPPVPGSDAERFEDFCEQNAGAC